MTAKQHPSTSHRLVNQAIRFGLAGVTVLMLGACGREEPTKGPAGSAGTDPAGQPSLIDRAIGLTKGATNALPETVTAAAAGATSQATGTAADKLRAAADWALTRGTGLAEVTTAKAQDWIDQAKSFIAKGRPDLAAGLVDKLRQVKSTLPAGLSAEVDRLDGLLKNAARQQPAPTAATPAAR